MDRLRCDSGSDSDNGEESEADMQPSSKMLGKRKATDQDNNSSEELEYPKRLKNTEEYLSKDIEPSFSDEIQDAIRKSLLSDKVGESSKSNPQKETENNTENFERDVENQEIQ